uniref:Olfactory receptor n=1 Tax=Suricata suricatta TaxID=37032 RepID=A0A673ULV2_SURSU
MMTPRKLPLLVSPIMNSSSFLLTGFSGLEKQYPWISIPFLTIYAMVLLGNCMVLHVIRTEPSLHQPMFYFLAMLALTDLCMGLSTVHTVLGILWGFIREISLDSCIAQSYFIHGLSFMESSVLLAMAFDRYVAICNPLRYSSILTNSRILKIGLTIVGRSFFFITPPIINLKFFHYCHSQVLSHSFCLHQDLLRVACSDIRFNSYYALIILGLFVITSTFGLDSLLIVVSYVLILHTVLGIASGAGKWRALNTCVSHICAVLVYYVPMISLSLLHRFGRHLPPLLQTVMANAYLFFPPVVNPIVYSIKTKEIRNSIVRLIDKETKSSLTLFP